MGATLAVMRTRVKNLLLDDDFFSDAVIDGHINDAYNIHFDLVKEILEDYFMKVELIDVVADANELTLPTDFSQLKTLGFSEDGESYAQLDYVTMDGFEPSSKGSPNRYDLVGENVIVFPVPDSAITDGFKLRYTHEITALAADPDTVEDVFNGTGQTCIEHWAVILAKGMEGLWSPGSTDARGFFSSYNDARQRFLNKLEMRTHQDPEIEAFNDFDGYDI